MRMNNHIEAVFATLAAYDPGHDTITIGGAALAVHLAAAGAEVGAQADVDTLCSGDYFAAKCRELAADPRGRRYQVREPYGPPELRALSPILDIKYDADNPTVLSFSASEALGGSWHPTYYQECLADADGLRVYRDYRFLTMAKLLVWTAISGRQKDISKVDMALPMALRRGLISETEAAHIAREREVSAALRHQFPGRHHARADDSLPARHK